MWIFGDLFRQTGDIKFPSVLHIYINRILIHFEHVYINGALLIWIWFVIQTLMWFVFLCFDRLIIYNFVIYYLKFWRMIFIRQTSSVNWSTYSFSILQLFEYGPSHTEKCIYSGKLTIRGPDKILIGRIKNTGLSTTI